MKSVSTLSGLSLLCVVVGVSLAASPWEALVSGPPETVKEVDVAKYVGRWYQMYANNFVLNTFERDNVCVTADYGVIDATTVSVFNAARLKTPDGDESTINGVATIPDPTDPGKLLVKFPDIPDDGKYWILKLGPFNSDGQYDYSIVSDDRRLTLFVLARNTVDFKKYDAEVLKFLAANGFTSNYNAPIETYQDTTCQYIPSPP